MNAEARSSIARLIKTEVRALLQAEIKEVRALVREQQQRRIQESEERRVRAYDNERLSTLLEGALGFYGGEASIILEDDVRLLRKHGFNIDEVLLHMRSFNEKVGAMIRELHPVVLRRGGAKNLTSTTEFVQPSGQ